jgi:hypothetical protein
VAPAIYDESIDKIDYDDKVVLQLAIILGMHKKCDLVISLATIDVY